LSQAAYCGRFAPSPTGPLHLGSLVTAVASYLEAKRHNGTWLVRIEDLDPPREVPGISTHILHTLQTFGFVWDGSVLYQSQQTNAYTQALASLQQQTYACRCTRKQLQQSAPRGPEGILYPGTCRQATNVKPPYVTRVNVNAECIAFHDSIQGHYQQHLETDVGDFSLRRRDQLFSYQLAVVVDDAAQGITHVVRGSDLLSSTPRQIYLQHLLHAPSLHYAHIPVIVNALGHKLSKQTHAQALNNTTPLPELMLAATYLGQHPPAHLHTVATFWAWAKKHWNPQKIPQTRSIPEMQRTTVQ